MVLDFIGGRNRDTDMATEIHIRDVGGSESGLNAKNLGGTHGSNLKRNLQWVWDGELRGAGIG